MHLCGGEGVGGCAYHDRGAGGVWGRGQRQPHKAGRFYVLQDMSKNLFTMTRAKNLTAFYL